MQLSAVYPMQFGEVVATAYLWSQTDGGMDMDAQQQFLECFFKRLPMLKEALVAIKGQIQEAGGFDDKDPGWPEMDLATPLDPELVRAALKKRKASQSTQESGPDDYSKDFDRASAAEKTGRSTFSQSRIWLCMVMFYSRGVHEVCGDMMLSDPAAHAGVGAMRLSQFL